jgi:beta-lactamase class A
VKVRTANFPNAAYYVTVLGILICACDTSRTPQIDSAVSSRPTPITVSQQARACPHANLARQFEEIARVTKGPVGAAAMLVETGELVVMNGKQQFPMQSVYKLPIGMAVLDQVDRGALKLDQEVKVTAEDLVPQPLHSPIRNRFPRAVELSVRELLHFMMVDSDGSACDVLLKLIGGTEPATKYLRSLGVEGIVVATSEKEMSQNDDVQYRNWSTPEAMVGLLQMLQKGQGLSTASRELVLDYMTKTETFPGRIKGRLPTGASVAHKTGSSGTKNGLTRATNDVGLITLPDGNHLAVAVFVSDTKADAATRDAVIAKITRAAWDCWTSL